MSSLPGAIPMRCWPSTCRRRDTRCCRLMRVSVDKNRGTVSAGLLGFLGKSEAVSRDGLGCASVPDGDVGKARRTAVPAEPSATSQDALWPEGERVDASQDPVIAQAARRRGADRHRHARGGRGQERPRRRRALWRRLFRKDAAARLVDDQDGECRDHRHAGQGRQDGGRQHRACSRRGRRMAAPPSALPT